MASGNDPQAIKDAKKQSTDLRRTFGQVVKPIHSKSMPVMLRNPEEWRAWLTLPIEEASKMQRPLPDDAIQIVARATKGD